MDQVEEIKQRIDIVDLIGSYVELKKAGANHKAICPFHSEKTPSFMVSADKGIFKCFGCGESGDIFTFIEKIEGVDFPEALKILAERAGVKLKRIDKKFYDQKRILYEINNKAGDVFYHILTKTKIGKPAMDYLKKRKVKEKTIQDFKIGYAPKNYEFLSNYLLKKGFQEKDIIASGLALKRDIYRKDSIPIYNRFRGRIMFPLYNPAGNVIAFSGRLLKEEEGQGGKYINTPETPIFSKSKAVFALDKAKTAIRKLGFVVLVEGQMDVILSHQAGFINTIASSGTALTEEQVEHLSRLTNNFLFAFDADKAGVEATKRGVEIALEKEIDVSIALIPEKFKDAAEVITKDPSIWKKSIKNAKPFLGYLFELAFSEKKGDLAPQEKRDIAKILLPQIAKIKDPIMAGDYIAKLADRLKTKESYLYDWLKKYEEKQEKNKIQSQENIKNQIKRTSKENHLLALLIAFPQYSQAAIKSIKENYLSSSQVIEVYKKLKNWYVKKRKFSLEGFLSTLSTGERDFVNHIVLDVENEYTGEDLEIAKDEIVYLIQAIKEENTKKNNLNYEEKIKKAEASGDKEKLKKLIREFQKSVISK